jgi:tetratricopeptide (TPR) repeat protein
MRLLMFLSVLACGGTQLAASKETWVEVKSPHFVAYTDAGEKEARKALEGFEGIRSVFSAVFPGIRVDPPKPMIIIVAENEASMKRFSPMQFEGKDPARPAGLFFKGTDRNCAILRLDIDHQVDQPYFVLFHEYTHSIIHQNFPTMPTWMDEGIADFYGATEIHSKQVYLGRVPVGRLLQLRSSVRLPIETLLTVNHDSPQYQEGGKVGVFYAQSWAFIHYLFMDKEAQKAGLFRTYLKALAHQMDPLAAAREGFGDLEKLQGDLTLYSRRPVFAFWNLPLTVKLADKDFQVRAVDGPEALVIRAEFLQHAGRMAEAGDLLRQALATAPGRPEILTALGNGHVLQGETEEARLAFEEALRLGSPDFRVPYHLALLAQDGPGSGSDNAGRILAWLEAALRLRPDFPGIHMALCRQYSSDPRDPKKAVQEGMKAVELEPENLANRVNLGYACMNLGLEPEAKIIGSQLEKLASTRFEKQMAESYASSLQRFLARKGAQSELAAVSLPSSGELQQRPMEPLKFSLPSYLAPLGNEVMQLDAEGKREEAIRRVEAALAKARYAYDRKPLKALLDALRKRVQPK